MSARALATRPRASGRLIASSLAAAAIAAGIVTFAGGGSHAAACPGMLVPAYVSPDALAGLAASAAPPRIVVVNPASGPGEAPQAAYARAIRRAQDAGIKVLGYVATSHGARDLDAAAADARRYATWYGVDGIFLDEAASDPAQLPYYRALARRVRSSPGGLVVLNPGAVPDRGYFDVADVVVTFEGSYADYRAALGRMPAWVRGLAPSRVAHLVYGASGQEARQAATAQSRAAYVYVTTGLLPNPWQTIPASVLAPGAPGRCA